MPSFWSWLCFPRKGYRTRSGEFRRSRTHTGEGDEGGFDFPHPSTKRKLKGNQQIHADHIRVQNQLNTQEPEVTSHPVDSEQRLVDDFMTNKRRRLQDIFNMNEDEKHFLDIENAHLQQKGYSKYSNDISRNNFLNNRKNSNFGSEYTPKGFQNQRVDNYHVVSMYRYVPKAVQNVYASKALEGGKVDDYFAHLHRQNSMTSFANAKMVHRNTDNIPTLAFQGDSTNNFTVTTADKISLIEKDENENVEEESEDLQERTDLNVATRTDSVLEASFDSMWNSNGEVLY